MPPNMSFSITTPQMYAGTKDITRRFGWANLKPGDLVMACEKCQGLGKGGRIKRIGLIEVVSNTPERLDAITLNDVRREGFPSNSKLWFIKMFCEHNKCEPDKIINRIVFKALYMDDKYTEAVKHIALNTTAVTLRPDIAKEYLGIPLSWVNAIIATVKP